MRYKEHIVIKIITLTQHNFTKLIDTTLQYNTILINDDRRIHEIRRLFLNWELDCGNSYVTFYLSKKERDGTLLKYLLLGNSILKSVFRLFSYKTAISYENH